MRPLKLLWEAVLLQQICQWYSCIQLQQSTVAVEEACAELL
jgi:hypothetical protein